VADPRLSRDDDPLLHAGQHDLASIIIASAGDRGSPPCSLDDGEGNAHTMSGGSIVLAALT
jgi:hypothetical protein